jgi:hypothetical protein
MSDPARFLVWRNFVQSPIWNACYYRLCIKKVRCRPTDFYSASEYNQGGSVGRMVFGISACWALIIQTNRVSQRALASWSLLDVC